MARFFRDFNRLTILPIIILAGFSLAILSASGGELLLSQSVFFLAGFLIYFIFSQIDYTVHQHLTVFYYLIVLVLLILTFFAPAVRGSSRWIEILGVRWQPSELVKPMLILVFAHFFSRSWSGNVKNLIAGFLLLILPLFLVFRQPDLGTAIIILGIWLGIVYASGLKTMVGFFGFLGGLILLPLFSIFLKDYQKARIMSFLNPYLDPIGSGYHSIQAMIAVGSGNFLGKGLGEGTQSRLLFLPESHTDFIFASLVENFGFLAGLIIILIYGFLLWRILDSSRKTKDYFASLVLLGTFTQIFLQVLVNIGMNIGLIPITGITLPLLSYGGSSVITTMLTLGIVANISKNNRENKAIDILR